MGNQELKEYKIIKREKISLAKDSKTPLHPHPLNAAIYGEDEDITWLVEQLRFDGLINPIKVNKDYRIVSGHLRAKTYQFLLNEAIQEGNQSQIDRYSLIPVEMLYFSDEESELQYLLSSNETRPKTPEQKLRELLQWKKLLEGPKFASLGVREKRARLKNQSGVTSDSSYRRLRRVLDHVENMEDEGRNEELSYFMDQAAAGVTINKLFQLMQQQTGDLSEITLAQVMSSMEAKLNEICAFYGIRWSLRMSRCMLPEDDPLADYRLKVVDELKELGVFDANETCEEVTLPIPRFAECLSLTEADLESLASQHGHYSEVAGLTGCKSNYFLARRLAELNGEDLPAITAKDLWELSQADLEQFAISQEIADNITQKIKRKPDPFAYCQLQVASYFGVQKEMWQLQQSEFEFERYFDKERDMNYGRCRLSVFASEGTDNLVIKVEARGDAKRAKDLARLLSKVSSDNIKQLLALVEA